MAKYRVFLWTFVVLTFVFYSPPARAGLFSNFFQLFTSGKDEVTEDSDLNSVALISFPLLGSVASSKDAVGGAEGIDPPTLANLQEAALVASRNPAGTLPASEFGNILIYTVQAGDVPGRIAEKFGISLNTLLWANNIRNPDLIKIGDELIILPVSGVRYEVVKGDTVDSIAKKFKSDPIDILSFNNLAVGEGLAVGDVIIIPNGEFAPVVRPTRTTAAFQLPVYSGYYLRPVVGGRRSRGLHGFNAVDLAQYCGASVLASAEGTVIIARPSGWNGGYGKYIVISHPNGTQTLYSHLSSLFVVPGRHVGQGAEIGTVGSTGNSTGCHVHFEVRGARNPF